MAAFIYIISENLGQNTQQEKLVFWQRELCIKLGPEYLWLLKRLVPLKGNQVLYIRRKLPWENLRNHQDSIHCRLKGSKMSPFFMSFFLLRRESLREPFLEGCPRGLVSWDSFHCAQPSRNTECIGAMVLTFRWRQALVSSMWCWCYSHAECRNRRITEGFA